jgi:DNA-binding NtrC family response regulator
VLKKGGAVTSKRVLILDDDRAQAPRLKDCFARFHHGCEYEVVAGTSASEIVTALTKGRPDLIILEPETEGFDTLSMVTKLRQHDTTIPIIAASTGKKRAAVEAIFRLGLFAYIPKPVDFVPLEHLVAMACRST